MIAITIRAVALALTAALAAAALPGSSAADIKKKPPISKFPPPGPLKKKLNLKCHVSYQQGPTPGSLVHKIRVTNILGYALPPGTKVYWRRKSGRTNPGGIILLGRGLPANHHVDQTVPSYSTACRAWIVASLY